MKKTLFALAIAAAPFLANASEANGIGYTHAQLDYTYSQGHSGNSGPYMNGGALSGSYAFTDNMFMTASYGKAEDSHMGLKYNTEAWSLGMGFNVSLGSRADWVSKIAYLDNELRVRDRDFLCDGAACTDRVHLKGGEISTGVMGRITDSVTANAYVGYEDFNNRYEGSYFADFGAVYSFNPTWAMHGGLRLNDGGEGLSLGVRASF